MAGNPFITFTLDKGSVRTTLFSLTANVTGAVVRAQAGLLAAGKRIEAKAKANVAPYRYDGRLHDAITTRVSTRGGLLMTRVTVGVHGRTFAPEGATFERGWRSEKGLQPPTKPLAEWAARRGLDPHLGFVIARAMGRRGYSFGERHWLSDAYAGEEPLVEATVARYMLAGWASEPRVPAGLMGAGRWTR